MKSRLIILAIGLVLISCKTHSPATEPDFVKFDERLKGKWVLEYMSPVNGKDMKQLFQIQKPYLNFVDADKVAGNNGCNNIAGKYTADGTIIRFHTDQFNSTKMFCQGVDETAFPGVLKTVNRYEVIEDGNKLLLLTSDIISITLVKAEE